MRSPCKSSDFHNKQTSVSVTTAKKVIHNFAFSLGRVLVRVSSNKESRAAGNGKRGQRTGAPDCHQRPGVLWGSPCPGATHYNRRAILTNAPFTRTAYNRAQPDFPSLNVPAPFWQRRRSRRHARNSYRCP